MARHYSAKSLFRQVPNALLARYFHAREVFEEVAIADMEELKVDRLFEAWLALDEDRRRPLDAELQEVFEMSTDAGDQSYRR
jgi:hypothetical protein